MATRYYLAPETRGYKRGVKNSMAKLNADKVREIRKLRYQEHLPVKDIAEYIGVACSTIQDVLYRKSWTHIP